MHGKCYLCGLGNPRICFPSDERQLRRWLVLLKCEAPGKVGHFGPRLCLKHFREEDIMKTKIGGVKLRQNACPLSSESSNPNLVTNDMILVSAEGNHIPINTSLLAAISPVLKDVLRYNHEHYEEKTKLLIQDYSTETLESFLELVHLEDVCLSGGQVEDVRRLISEFGINLDYFSVSPVEDMREYLSRYSSNSKSNTTEAFQYHEDSSLSKEMDRSVRNDDKTNNIHPSCSRPAKEKVTCPFDNCGIEFTTRRLFFKHVVNSHMFDELMQQIPRRGEDGVTKCPYQDCKFESRSPDQRPMLYHYSIIHEIVYNKFDSMFPNHSYGTKNKATG